MQIEIKPLNGTADEIEITVESERVDAAYEKYLAKASRNVEVPGFRKGKAPLNRVLQLHGEKIKDYFEKDFISEIWDEAARENGIHYLLYPEVKDLKWSLGGGMVLLLEVEHEPTVEFQSTEGLRVPYRPLELEDELERFLQDLIHQNSTISTPEQAEEGDLLELLIGFDLSGESVKRKAHAYSRQGEDLYSLPELRGMRGGETTELELTGDQLDKLIQGATPQLDKQTKFHCQIEVVNISRQTVPALDDEFAKDMQFADLAEMRAKVREELRPQVQERNRDGENSAIIATLYQENQFSLPEHTIRYVVREQLERIDPKYRQLISNRVVNRAIGDSVTMYVLKALRARYALELTDELLEQYLAHLAVLSEMSAGAYKEANAEEISTDSFREAAVNYTILRQIAATCEFVEPPAETTEEANGAEDEATEDSEDQA